MGGEITLAGQVVDELARWWPAVSAAAGGAAVKLLDRVRDKTTEVASDAAAGWARRVVLRVFTRRTDGTPVDPDGQVPDDAVVDAEVAETLDDLAADPDSRPARRLLARYVDDAVAADPALVGILRELLDQAPAGTTGAVGTSGAIDQRNTGGINIATTGTTRDINLGGAGR